MCLLATWSVMTAADANDWLNVDDVAESYEPVMNGFVTEANDFWLIPSFQLLAVDLDVVESR